MISVAPGLRVRSMKATGACGNGDACGKVSGSANGLPLSSKKFRRACEVTVPLFTSVKMVFQRPAEAKWAIDPEPTDPPPELMVRVTVTVVWATPGDVRVIVPV